MNDTVHVPDVEKPMATLCYAQGPDLFRCDRKLGHEGLHSWEWLIRLHQFRVQLADERRKEAR